MVGRVVVPAARLAQNPVELLLVLGAMAPFQPTGTSRLIGAKQSTLAVTLEFSTRVW